MWLVGAAYNLCRPHRSLRQRVAADGAPIRRWLDRTPAQAGGLGDHPWSIHEPLSFPVPGVGIARRGRRPKWLRGTGRAA
jgi:hypothetical protein